MSLNLWRFHHIRRIVKLLYQVRLFYVIPNDQSGALYQSRGNITTNDLLTTTVENFGTSIPSLYATVDVYRFVTGEQRTTVNTGQRREAERRQGEGEGRGDHESLLAVWQVRQRSGSTRLPVRCEINIHKIHMLNCRCFDRWKLVNILGKAWRHFTLWIQWMIVYSFSWSVTTTLHLVLTRVKIIK